MRLVIVSNRLPFTIAHRHGKLLFRQSPGGLASGLKAYLDWLRKYSKNLDYIWIGWPGGRVRDDLKDEVKTRAFSEHQAVPVFLDEEVVEKYYNGFCNSTIWPLFHYFPQQARFETEDWKAYARANEIFCNVVSSQLKQGDIVWIHDYQLMLMPKMLRQRVPDSTIGFFLHIPFPSSEMVRLLPIEWRRNIMSGLLGADLIGFQTVDYTLHFLQSVLRVLGIEHTMGEMMAGDRIVQADTFPIGVDVQGFEEMVGTNAVQRQITNIREPLADMKIIFSIDRLDYTKGLEKRLVAFKFFLEKYREWQGKVVMVLTIVPSRLNAGGYQPLKEQIDKLVGEINGRFGKVDWTPILYQYKPVSQDYLLAMYATADVCFITPVRDGMNLVAKEYVATKKNRPGVLVLSEMAGAAKELGEAVIVNPNGIEEMANGLATALTMPYDEQIQRNRIMRKRLEQYDIVRWGEDFTDGLFKVKQVQGRFNSRLLDVKARNFLTRDYNRSARRLLLLDYDGTLTPFKETPELARPGADLIGILQKLSEDSRNNIVLVSSRDRQVLDNWFGKLKIGIAAEYGVWLRDKKGHWELTRNFTNDWKTRILPLLNSYASMVPGSFVEEKEYSLAWHYRRADPQISLIRLRELVDEVSDFLRNTDLQVLQHSKVVEVKNAGISKGATAQRLISKIHPDFILAIGDATVDEEMFSVLADTAYSIRVGLVDSSARYNLRNSDEVLQLLADLSRTIIPVQKQSVT